jgi:hypothetical protein
MEAFPANRWRNRRNDQSRIEKHDQRADHYRHGNSAGNRDTLGSTHIFCGTVESDRYAFRISNSDSQSINISDENMVSLEYTLHIQRPFPVAAADRFAVFRSNLGTHLDAFLTSKFGADSLGATDHHTKTDSIIFTDVILSSDARANIGVSLTSSDKLRLTQHSTILPSIAVPHILQYAFHDTLAQFVAHHFSHAHHITIRATHQFALTHAITAQRISLHAAYDRLGGTLRG